MSYLLTQVLTGAMQVAARDCLLISQVRSGTTVTVKLLDQNGYAFVSEAFVTAVEHPLRYRAFLESRGTLAADFLRNPLASLKAYVAWLKKRLDRPHVGLDVKFERLSFFNGGLSVLDEPRLIQWAKSEGALILHLVRENRFAQYVSTARATTSGIWHIEPDGTEVRATGGRETRTEPAGPPPVVHIDIPDCEAFMAASLRKTEMMRAWCAAAPTYREIAYETLYDRDGLTPSGREALEDLFGIRIASPPPLKRIRSVLAIENLAEVRGHFAGTPLAGMVEKALADEPSR